MQLRVDETPTRLKLAAEPAVLKLLKGEFSYQPPDYWRSPSYQLYRATLGDPRGPQGWDGHLSLVEMVRGDVRHAVMFRGHKEELLRKCEEWAIDVTGTWLASPLSGLTVDDVPERIVKAKFQLDHAQKVCVVNLLNAGIGVVRMTVSSGKTVMFAALAAMIKAQMPAARVLYITPTERLVKQVFEEMGKFLPQWGISQAGGGKKDLTGKDMVVATMAQLANKKNLARLHGEGFFKTFTVLLVDECFPAGTRVDGRPIEQLSVGDSVTSFNHETKTLERRKITRLFKSAAPSVMVVVRFSSGRSLVCTTNHPVFSVTRNCYVSAIELTSRDMVLTTMNEFHPLHAVRQACAYAPQQASERSAERVRSGILQQGLRGVLPSRSQLGDHVQDESEVCLCTDEVQQPYEPARRAGRAEHFSPRGRLETLGARGEWKTDTGDPAVASLTAGLDNGSGRPNSDAATEQISYLLQNRHREPRAENRDRGGRRLPHVTKSPSLRPEKDCVSGLDRVDAVEVFESANPTGRECVCSGGFVYNIEVEGNHNYFAGGVLVHNCHHAPADTWSTVIRLVPALFRYGASDTVKDERETDICAFYSIRGLFGPVRATIDVTPLIHTGRVAKPHLHLIDIPEWEGQYDHVPHRAELGTPAWCLLDGVWCKGTYQGGAVDENVTDELGQPIELKGTHTLDLPDRGPVDVESRWCLLERAYDIGVIRHKARNKLVVEWVQHFTSKGWPTLVVATRSLHVLILEQLLITAGLDVETLTGDDTTKERDRVFKWLMQKPGRVLISPLVKEGVSLPELRGGVIADVVASPDLARQLIGRFIRKKPTGDNEAHIAWFIDRGYKSARKNCLNLFQELEKIRGFTYSWPCAGPGLAAPKYEHASFD